MTTKEAMDEYKIYISRDYQDGTLYKAHKTVYPTPDEAIAAIKECDGYRDVVWVEVSDSQVWIYETQEDADNAAENEEDGDVVAEIRR